ncbi:hypothetical protein [Georgenia wangjunii]|uniref:hypothetical protein n=1 Tax=Georgenia wangjunii TaxID=3117730 RepID=UPI003D9C3E8C
MGDQHPQVHRPRSRLADLVALGSLTRQATASLDAAVIAGFNVLVSGATQQASRQGISPPTR